MKAPTVTPLLIAVLSLSISPLASAAEVRTCLHVARGFGYVEALDAVLLDQLDRIIATVYRLVHR